MAFDAQSKIKTLKTGKAYLEVKWRLVWFREQHPDWAILTEIIEANEKQAIFKASILTEKGNLMATAHGSETPRDFGDYFEKAETKAIGRALALIGYGTQFAPDLEEDGRIVDSPTEASKPPVQSKTSTPPPARSFDEVDLSKASGPPNFLDYVAMRGGKQAGKTWGELPDDYLGWMRDKSNMEQGMKDKAAAVLAWRKKQEATASPQRTDEIPMPTDADAPDEALQEEPPW